MYGCGRRSAPGVGAARRLRRRDREREVAVGRRERDHARFGLGDEQRDAGVRVVAGAVGASSSTASTRAPLATTTAASRRALDARPTVGSNAASTSTIAPSGGRKPSFGDDVHRAVAARDDAVEPGAVGGREVVREHDRVAEHRHRRRRARPRRAASVSASRGISLRVRASRCARRAR